MSWKWKHEKKANKSSTKVYVKINAHENSQPVPQVYKYFLIDSTIANFKINYISLNFIHCIHSYNTSHSRCHNFI